MARHEKATVYDGTRTTSTSKTHSLIQKLLRALQFLSALTSLIIFSVRIAKIIRLVGKASRSNGAVEGILAAAVLYTLLTMAMTLGVKALGSNIFRMLFVLFDLLFVAAFIVVAVLTSPRRHGSSAPCTSSKTISAHVAGRVNCSLPWGTFILAIVSTLLHAITAAFHVAKDHRKNKRAENVHDEGPGIHQQRGQTTV
ncbi:hypothetical protein LSUE1_G009926 [Lachnellula suecica]|uniref:MARVEL domain-containing protein n=1 Tax=Lachnellula suecica TaxID=602035 RepID=A0A8T9BTY6_9HELO|nr:hypothetical protein LSUE1_G009926 [Lachnellula suecica]